MERYVRQAQKDLLKLVEFGVACSVVSVQVFAATLVVYINM